MVDYFVMCISFLIISKCYGVGIEYYDDQDNSGILTDDTTSSDGRRIVHDDNFEDSNAWEHNDTNYLNNSSTGKYGDNDYNNSVLNNIQEHRHQTQGDYLNTPLTYNLSSKLFSIFDEDNFTVVVNSDTIFPSDLYKEYEYMYDDDTKPHMLRQHSQKLQQVKETDNLEINRKLPLTDFYNLEPAIRYLNLSYNNYSINKNLWYIQEDVPCWDLPLLYGELSKMKKYSEVFTMRGGELKNVIINKSNFDWSPASSKRTTPPLTYYTSKWCTVEPCYGDHTLCLFSDKTTSSLCDKKYQVNVPSILEQTALVNTINSMRNKIANGESQRYSYLPPAANMKQITYDYDLAEIAKVWLHQCLPGSAPCSALDDAFVTQLECTKYARYCCLHTHKTQFTKCIPKPECFVLPVIGCLHVWFWSAGDKLTTTDVVCGHTSVSTYNTVQLLWASTNKIGCAYGQNAYGDVRVICNFSPGAPFIVDSKYYCGIVKHKERKTHVNNIKDIVDPRMLMSLGVSLKPVHKRSASNTKSTTDSKLKEFGEHSDSYWGVNILSKIYKEGWVRNLLKDYSNGTTNLIARLVVKYEFIEQSSARCDSDQPIYIIGAPGSLCVERGRRYHGLCYDFRDPTPGYRLVAVIAPIALFSLILYDLFSGVVRQTNY